MVRAHPAGGMQGVDSRPTGSTGIQKLQFWADVV